MIEFHDVSYVYGSTSRESPALVRVDLTVRPGEHVVLLGANGSGKSTLVRLANGLLTPSSGVVMVDGLDTRDPDAVWCVRTKVGVVFQDPDNQIVATTVEEDVAFGPENLGMSREHVRERVDAALAAVGLSGLERREPHHLSAGQKQRLALAGALALDPAYLVLDEPTAMLDPSARRELREVIAAQVSRGRGVIHVTHDLVDCESADRMVVLSGGQLVFDGPPGEVVGETTWLEAYGISVPPIVHFSNELRAQGVPVPPVALSAERAVSQL